LSDDLFFGSKHDHPYRSSAKKISTLGGVEQAAVSILRDREIQLSLWLLPLEQEGIEDELPESALQVGDLRAADEALDLYRDLLAAALGREGSLGPQVHSEAALSEARMSGS
jgi:hypothetical protein